MDFALSDRQRAFQQKVREFVASAVDPVASDLDRQR
jgi:alkylation response protein AidB-like acyl-CoA dehydrogenase